MFTKEKKDIPEDVVKQPVFLFREKEKEKEKHPAKEKKTYQRRGIYITFDIDDPEEKELFEYLKKLPKDKLNRFCVESMIFWSKKKESHFDKLFDIIGTLSDIIKNNANNEKVIIQEKIIEKEKPKPIKTEEIKIPNQEINLNFIEEESEYDSQNADAILDRMFQDRVT